MKILLMSILLSLPFVPAMAQPSGCSTTVGGNPVTIPVPVPAQSYVTVGSDKRAFFEWMVPDDNRLLCVFVPANILPGLKNPAGGLDRYMLVETTRRMDDGKAAVTATDFDGVIANLKEMLGNNNQLNQTAQSSSEEASRKLKAIDQSKDVDLGKPTPLGVVFQKQDAFAFAMVFPVSSGGTAKKVINVSVLMRIRDRLVFAYVYAAGSDVAALQWAEQTAEAWAPQVLSAN